MIGRAVLVRIEGETRVRLARCEVDVCLLDLVRVLHDGDRRIGRIVAVDVTVEPGAIDVEVEIAGVGIASEPAHWIDTRAADGIQIGGVGPIDSGFSPDRTEAARGALEFAFLPKPGDRVHAEGQPAIVMQRWMRSRTLKLRMPDGLERTATIDADGQVTMEDES